MDEELSMRDSIEAAITTLGEDSGMDPAPVVEPVESTEVHDAQGKTAEEETAAKTTEGEIPGEGNVAKIAGDDGGRNKGGSPAAARSEQDEQTPGDITKAPESWTPAAREGWKNIPEPVRQQIHKREGELGKALMDGSTNRKRGEQFTDISNRYAQVIAAEGVTDPIAGFESMMQIMSVLRMGTDQQKAQKIAEFIGGYGISVPMLDNILANRGAPAPGGNGAGDPNRAYIDEQLAPVNQLLNRLNQQERQTNLQRNQAYLAEVTEFGDKNEFYQDVKNDMADMVEMAANRKYDMPLAEAYAKACALNPEVSKIMADRAATAELAQGGKILQGKRNASSSIMAGQSSGGPAGEDLSLRETLEQAYDAQVG